MARYLVNITRQALRRSAPNGGKVVVPGAFMHSPYPLRRRAGGEGGAVVSVRGTHCVSFEHLRRDGVLPYVEGLLHSHDEYDVLCLTPGVLALDLPSAPGATTAVLVDLNPARHDLPEPDATQLGEDAGLAAQEPIPPTEMEMSADAVGESADEREQPLEVVPPGPPAIEEHSTSSDALPEDTSVAEEVAASSTHYPWNREELEAMSLADLRGLAADAGLTLRSRLKEDFVVALLQQAE